MSTAVMSELRDADRGWRIKTFFPSQPVADCETCTKFAGGMRFWRTKVVLGGGLNNMLMNVAQLLALTCEPGNVLVMPNLDADPLRCGVAHSDTLV